MVARAILFLLLLGLFGDTGPGEGRRGNELFREAQYADAEAAYRNGLSALNDTSGTVYAALQNNLALALHRQGRPDEARAALARARRAASTDAERVRILFNAGTVAAAMDDRTAALRHYERALLLDPSHETARFNYEYLKRITPQGGTPRSRSEDVEPSAFARQLKEEADARVAAQEYETAAALMRDGLRRDSTVRAYRDFITRIEDIAQINRTSP